MIIIAIVGVKHLIDLPPAQKATYISIVDKKIGVYLSANAFFQFFFGVASIYGIKDYIICLAVFYRFLQVFALPKRPKNQFMSLLLKCFKGIKSEKHFISNLGITMLNNSAVKIYVYSKSIFTHHPLIFCKSMKYRSHSAHIYYKTCEIKSLFSF